MDETHRRGDGRRVFSCRSAHGPAARKTDGGVNKAPAARFEDPARLQKLSGAFKEIDALFGAFAGRSRMPGAAWGIVVDGELAHAGATGYRDLTSKAAANPDTVFRIASMTKSFTAMAILKLREEGKLGLDDPAERYVPELKSLAYPTDDSPRITIRHLLTHAEGFPEDNPWGDRQLAITPPQMRGMLRGGIPFSNPPGVAYEYSNYGFAILGLVIGRASGNSYNDYLRTRILEPLRMTATTMEPSGVPADRLARGYRSEAEGWTEEPLLADGAFGPMGGMLTSVRDLSRYVGVFLGAWPPRDGPETAPLSRAALREMQQIHRFSGAATTRDPERGVQMNAAGYGYGLRAWQTCTFRHIVAHSGGLPGFGSQMLWLPEYGVGLIVLGNATYAPWSRVLPSALEILDRTGGLQPRRVQPSAALVDARNAIAQLVERWDDRAAENIAAQNLFLDTPAARRRADLEALHTKYGACLADRDRFDTIENALRGQWIMQCERGRLLVSITLAPTMPPKVQFFSVHPAPAERPSQASCAQ